MPTSIMTLVQLVGAGANMDVRPPAGIDWEVTMVGSSIWVGAPPLGVPRVNAGIFDGVNGPAWVLAATDVRGWGRRQQLFVSRTNYLRLNNPGAGGENISFSAKVTRIFGVATDPVITDVQTIGIGANMDVIPPAGIECEITDIGSGLWVGGAPWNLPDVNVSIMDGVTAVPLMLSTDLKGWYKQLNIYIDDQNYLRVTNTNVAGQAIAVVGTIARIRGTAATAVMSDVRAIGAGATIVIRPPLGEEWAVTDIGGSVWVGVPPGSLPNITVEITNGVIASIIARPVDNTPWIDDMEIDIDNTNYIQITDTGGAGCNICFSAYKTRIYQS